jgi:hypothetical protein
MKLSGVAGGLGFVSLFGVLGNTVGVPWGVLLAVAVLIIVSATAVTIVQQLMPQDSDHKLQLWTAMIKQRGRRAGIAPASQHLAPGKARRVSSGRKRAARL